MMARDGKIKINSFPGATTQDMHHYLKPLLARKPDHVILHCGTNNLMNSLDAEDVANKIIELTLLYQVYFQEIKKFHLGVIRLSW